MTKQFISAKLNINGYFVDEIYINRYGEDNREWYNLIFLEDGTYARFGFKKEFLDTLQSMDNVIQLNRNIKKGGKRGSSEIYIPSSITNAAQ